MQLCKSQNCRQSRSSLCSQGLLLLLVPKVCTELGNKVFMYPASWNALQKDFNLVWLVSLNVFRSLNPVVISSTGRRSFNSANLAGLCDDLCL